MKKSTFTISFCLLASKLLASIVYTNPTDIVLPAYVPPNSSQAVINMDNTGVAEFTFDTNFDGPEVWLSVDNKISTISAANPFFRSMKAYGAGISIDANSGYFDFGQAILGGASAQSPFPIGDHYLGVKFKIGANLHFGWILVNNQANGIVTIKSYAYENTPNVAILTGATGVSTAGLNDSTLENLTVYPNPSATGVYSINLPDNFDITVTDALGKIYLEQQGVTGINNISLNESNGIFILKITSKDASKVFQLLR